MAAVLLATLVDYINFTRRTVDEEPYCSFVLNAINTIVRYLGKCPDYEYLNN